MLEKIKKSMWIWLPLVTVAAMAVLIIVMSGKLPAGIPVGSKVEVVPTKLYSDGVLIEPDTSFIIEGSMDMTEAELRSLLVLEPEVGYGLRRNANIEAPPNWVLTPATALAPEATISIGAGLGKQQFTAAPVIIVTEVYPRNGSAGVSPRSGVELTFNVDDLGSDAVGKALVINPTYESYIGTDKNEVNIYPNDKLAYGSTYTVSLSAADLVHPKGYKLRGDFSTSFTTISEIGERMENLVTLSARNSYNILTTETPILDVSLDRTVVENGTMPKVAVNLYSVSDVLRYKQLLAEGTRKPYKRYDDFAPSTEGLTLTSSFDTEPVSLADDSSKGSVGAGIIAFPEPLAEGRYLAELSFDMGEGYTIKRYRLMQSSDLSVYFMHTGDSAVLWTNDATTGNPAAGASFVLEGTLSTPPLTTGEDGVAMTKSASLAVNDKARTGVFTVEWQGHTFVDSNTFMHDYSSTDPSTRYISTLFTDRPLYQGTDTVKVWGMVRPRRDTIAVPTDLRLSMDGIEPVAVTLDDKGFFVAELSLDSLAAGYYRLSLDVGEQSLYSSTLRVYQYVKPVYTAEISTSQPVYLMSDRTTPRYVDVTMTMFDGTPLPDFRGSLGTIYGNSDAVRLASDKFVTDKDGNARVDISGFGELYSSWYPESLSLTVRNEDAEEDNFLASSSFLLVPRDLMLTAKLQANGDTGTVTVNTNRIDMSRITSPEQLQLDPETTLKGEPVSTKITATLRSREFVKTQDGMQYDYINRVSVPRYKYEQVEKDERSFEVVTDAAGVATIPDLPTRSENKNYYLDLTALDSTGAKVLTTVYLIPEVSYRSRTAPHSYSFKKVVDADELARSNDGSGRLYEWQYMRTFNDGEEVSFRLHNGDQPLDTMTGRMLWTTVQTEFERVSVTDKDTISIPFAEDLLPNYLLTGIYFDGKHVFTIGDTGMDFNKESRKLSIAVETGGNEFHPGDKVAVSATVTDTAGKPQPNANVVVAVVDEAIFALESQYVNPLSDIYGRAFSPIINRYSSYGGPDTGGGAEMGGGGGENPVRDKFPDTALFATARTDQSGKASFSLELPDSITSWRITSLAVTDSNYAGNVAENIVSTKEFFVTPMHTVELIEGDDFTVGLRGAGKGVTTEDAVSYSVTVEGNGVSKTVEVTTAGIREYGWATFEGLATGDYTVTVSGKCKEYSDAVRLPFSIVKSGIQMNRTETVDPSKGINISPVRYPVTMTLFDKNRELYDQVLWSVRNASYGARADMKIGMAYTDRILSRMSGDSGSYNTYPDLSADLGQYGQYPLRLLPFVKDPDMRLTALAMLAADELFARMPYGNWEDPAAHPNEQYQLAAPGAFYLMQAVVGSYNLGHETGVDSMELPDKLDLAIAHLLAGDKAGAQKTYDELVAPLIRKTTALSGATAYSLPEVGNASPNDCTAAATRLAIMLGSPDADSFIRYILERPRVNDTFIMEQLLYLDHADSIAPAGNAKVSYTLDGKRKTEELVEGFVTLTLSRKQLAELSLTVDAGEARATMSYTAEPDAAQLENRTIPITKTVVPADGSESYTVGDLVKVTLTPDISSFSRWTAYSELIVDDILPSGIKFDRFEPDPKPTDMSWWLTYRDGQRLRFSTYANSSRMVPIVYYARNAMPGTYVLEGVMVSSGAGDTWGSSERGKLRIEP